VQGVLPTKWQRLNQQLVILYKHAMHALEIQRQIDALPRSAQRQAVVKNREAECGDGVFILAVNHAIFVPVNQPRVARQRSLPLWDMAIADLIITGKHAARFLSPPDIVVAAGSTASPIVV